MCEFISANADDPASIRSASIPLWLAPPLSPPYDQDEIDDGTVGKDDNDRTYGEADKDVERVQNDKDYDYDKIAEVLKCDEKVDNESNVGEENGGEEDLNDNDAVHHNVDKDAQDNKESTKVEDASNETRDVDDKGVEDAGEGLPDKNAEDDKDRKDDKDINDDKDDKAETIEKNDKIDKDPANGFRESASFDGSGSDDPDELTDEAPEPEAIRKRDEHIENVESNDANVPNDKSECSTSTGVKSASEQPRRIRSKPTERKKVWEM